MPQYKRDRKAMLRILRAQGLEPSDMAAEGHTFEGYYRFVRNADGHRVEDPRDGTLLKRFVPWPNGFPYTAFRWHARKVFPNL